MKINYTIFFLVLHFVGFSQQDVNFHHKKIDKFIKKVYKIDKYKLQEIQLNKKSTLNGKFFIVKNDIDSLSVVYIGRVNSCRADGCSIDGSSTDGSFEYFDYVITFDKDKKILDVKVFNYQATHGQEITAKSWLKQFRYKENLETFSVNKNIDAISGATISVYAITDDINIAHQRLLTEVKLQSEKTSDTDPPVPEDVDPLKN